MKERKQEEAAEEAESGRIGRKRKNLRFRSAAIRGMMTASMGEIAGTRGIATNVPGGGSGSATHPTRITVKV